MNEFAKLYNVFYLCMPRLPSAIESSMNQNPIKNNNISYFLKKPNFHHQNGPHKSQFVEKSVKKLKNASINFLSSNYKL